MLCTELIPSLTGRPPPSNLECALFALPARTRGLGICIPSMRADQEHQSSLMVTSTLRDHILLQDETYSHDVILQSKATVRNQNKEKSSKDAHYIMHTMRVPCFAAINIHVYCYLKLHPDPSKEVNTT